MNQHFLQSHEWRKFQESLGRQVFEQAGNGWSFLALLESTPVGSYLYLPYGPTVRDEEAFHEALSALKGLVKDTGALFLRIEPTGGVDASLLVREGFLKTREVNPEHTWVLDLTQPAADILSKMKQNNRNLFKNYAKKGLAIQHTTNPQDITYLTNLLSGVAARNGINVHSAAYLQKQMSKAGAMLYYVTLNECNERAQTQTEGQSQDVLAAALVYDSSTTRYYAHAAASYEHRKLQAGTVLVAQMIMDAKEQGQTSFDFYGITTSDDPQHPWQGFTKFKQSFGGAPRAYLGCWDLPIRRLRYRLYGALRAINRRLKAAR